MVTYERRYNGQDHHTVRLFGTEWKLPLVEINTNNYIASDAQLVLGKPEFVEQAGIELSQLLDKEELDYLVTPEAKALPLTQIIAQELGLEYAVARKSVKDYMRNPYITRTDSITTSGEQQLVFDGPVAENLHSSRVCVIDDVVSTGGTMEALESILTDIGSDITSKAAIFEEGLEHTDIETLSSLPLFVTE